MPYIKQKQKDELEVTGKLTNAGELNYALTIICKRYFQDNGGRYQQINDVLGALSGCQMEFYRRLVGPYEDTKIKENGDVY